MDPLSEQHIRASFVNVSVRERAAITVPDLEEIDWSRRDFLGWRDKKSSHLAYIVVEIDGAPVGVVMRQADAAPRSRAQCAWCNDVTLPNEVVLFGARKAGRAGRNGDTIGTLACARFECPDNVRRLPPPAYLGFDVEAARQRRIVALGENVRGFVRGVLDV